jgi:penicillin-binding protein 1A
MGIVLVTVGLSRGQTMTTSDRWPRSRRWSERRRFTPDEIGKEFSVDPSGNGPIEWVHDFGTRPPRSRASRLGRALCKLAVLAVVASGIFTALLALTVLEANRIVHAVAETVHPSPVHLPPLAQRSVIYGRDGSVVAVLHADDNRQAVSFDQMSPSAVNAVVDTEDAHYWDHGAVDGRSMMRAFVTDMFSGRVRQGGSTIAQQLVKNTLLSPRRNLQRKVQEIVLADRVQHQLGKRAVLERYLNTVYFGEGAYGLQAAAETYFGVAAVQLSPAQGALLAGLIQDPDAYDPIRHPDAAKARRETVLERMAAHGHLGLLVAETAGLEPLPTSVTQPPPGNDYVSDAVKQQLMADPRLGAKPQQRYHRIYEGGLQIHTTMDPALQRQAQDALARGLPSGYNLSAALVTIDPSTGGILAVSGGPDFNQLQFDAALYGGGRQTGSAFKVFTLAAALEDGFSPNDFIDGTTPCAIPNPQGTPNPWKPGNFEGEAFGWLTITDATAHSVNCAYARLAMMVGLRRVADVAHAMGITSRLAIVPSMTLGTNSVTPVQMASAFATLAADGVRHTPHLVDTVTDSDGGLVLVNQDQPTRVIPSQIAREVTQILRQVVLQGTGTRANVYGHEIAGKTGTAENYHDAWFVGYTPQLATAVWMGNASGEVPMLDIEGINVQGGSFPAHMWHTFMTQALDPLPAPSFPQPDPSQIPAGVVLVDGQPRSASAGPAPPPGAPPGGSSQLPPPPGGTTNGTTWCWSSCGKPGPPHP